MVEQWQYLRKIFEKSIKIKNIRLNIEMRKKIEFEEINNYLENIVNFDNILTKNNNPKNQLFRNEFSFVFLNNFINKLFNIDLNSSTNYSFSKKTLITKNIKDILLEYIDELKKIYIKCKHKIYLENLNEKKIITIIRQLLRIYDFDLKAKEKYENGKKYLLYTISKKKINNNIKKIDSTINFD